MATIPWIAGTQEFPPAAQALSQPNGLLAAGGDLGSARLLAAYRQGVFPWYEEPDPILWWSPDPRAVLVPAQLHLSSSLRKVLRRQRFTVRADTAFRHVIEACAAPRSADGGTWIEPRTTPSLCSSPGRRRSRAGPSRRTPTRSLSGSTRHAAEPSAARAEGANQSRRGPSTTRRVTSSAGCDGGTRSDDASGPTASPAP